jgi:hypothetical protein
LRWRQFVVQVVSVFARASRQDHPLAERDIVPETEPQNIEYQLEPHPTFVDDHAAPTLQAPGLACRLLNTSSR